MTSLTPSLKRSACEIDIKVEIDEELECDSYPGALSQISINLIQNAQVHAFDGRKKGVIKVKAQRNEKEGFEDAVELIFEDDGVGMSESVAQNAFDPFFTTKAATGGSGIGLSLSSKLAKTALGGSLSVDREYTTGARFVLRFPKKMSE